MSSISPTGFLNPEIDGAARMGRGFATDAASRAVSTGAAGTPDSVDAHRKADETQNKNSPPLTNPISDATMGINY